MLSHHIELLAPAGDFACLQAAFNAGADAVYLGGERFGARAYAPNFDADELLRALQTAHLFHKKLYLTVNTLVKEKEMDGLVPYLRPLYEAGLDGVIVQDMGALMVIRRHFPQLELHASTQMTVTGAYGAAFLQQLGVCRVVPSRELSLTEIREIKERTGMEVETFIHGAMCYSYSGQCLLSSMLGGRSGNRGRCAGPCRLPYRDANGRTQYPLSLKDMDTLSILPELIAAGIDSFKIEGRMKSAEYVAGVTAMYRRYIDAYLDHPERPYQVAPQDSDVLRGLYTRGLNSSTGISRGYYKQHNGKNMVTLREPGYQGCDETVLEEVRNRYLRTKQTLPITGMVTIRAGEPAALTLCAQETSVTIEGEVVSEAHKRPLSREDIAVHISKTGDTDFELTRLEVTTDEHSFMTVKALNELRREACAQLETALIGQPRVCQASPNIPEYMIRSDRDSQYSGRLHALVNTIEQLQTAIKYDTLDGIYISSDIMTDLVNKINIDEMLTKKVNKKCCLALPYILRRRSYHFLKQYEEWLFGGLFHGVLVRNLEELQWLEEIGYQGERIADMSIYAWNRESLRFYGQYFDRHTMPTELNRSELSALAQADRSSLELCVYGRLPLMLSANCVRQTLASCDKSRQEPYGLTDRYRKVFPVAQNCQHCYNILYNSVPLSLHGQLDELRSQRYGVYRLDYTTEDAAQTAAVLDYYCGRWNGDTPMGFPIAEYTNGHYKRGVE